MWYIFYADVYFIQNFMMKATVLYLALYCSRMRAKISAVSTIWKIGIASFVGTLVEIIGLLFLGNYSIYVVLVFFIQIPFMTGFVLGKEKKRSLHIMLNGYFFMILVNGVLEALWNYFGEYGSFLFFLLFSCSTVVVAVRIWRNYNQMQKGIFSVELLHGGNRIQEKALYDSGNHLKDPYTGDGVHIISGTTADKLGIGRKEMTNVDSYPVYVPFQALGIEKGVLEVYYIEALIVEGEKGRITIQNCPLGVTKENLFEGKNYQIILNEEVF